MFSAEIRARPDRDARIGILHILMWGMGGAAAGFLRVTAENGMHYVAEFLRRTEMALALSGSCQSGFSSAAQKDHSSKAARSEDPEAY